MPNLIFNLMSFNGYLLLNFRFDKKAFHKDCDNKGILYYYFKSKNKFYFTFRILLIIEKIILFLL